MTTDDRIAHIESDITTLKSDVSVLKADVSDLKAEVKEIKGTLTQVLQLLARIDGRLDEQRATLNALIATRIAAVPSAA